MVNEKTKVLIITSFFLLIFVCFTAYHESVHVQINTYYSMPSKLVLSLNNLGVGIATKFPENFSNINKEKWIYLQSLNEIVGYNLLVVLFSSFCLAIMIILLIDKNAIK